MRYFFFINDETGKEFFVKCEGSICVARFIISTYQLDPDMCSFWGFRTEEEAEASGCDIYS